MARKGAPPLGHLGDGAPLPSIELASIATRGRLSLPIYGRSHLPWLKMSAARIALTLVPEGLVEIRPWIPFGEEIESAIEAAAVDPIANATELIAIRERYAAGRMESPGRLVLPPRALHHLGVFGRTAQIITVFFADRVELWSDRYREERLRTSTAE